jgi:protein-S-isoprenylcysteine O-methyltransferase Ste14
MKFLENPIPPPLVMLLFGALGWWLARLWPQAALNLAWQPIWTILLGLAGLTLPVLGMREFRRVQTTVNPLKPEEASAMVTSGIFARTRNPMYVGLSLLLAAWLAYLQNAVGLLALGGFVLYLHFWQVLPEERALARKFPEDFARYCAQVRRWL